MKRNQFATYVMPDLAVKITDTAGNVIAEPSARHVGLTVEFDYDPGNREDKPQVYITAIKSAGATLECEDLMVNFYSGRDIQEFLVQPDIDAIKEELVERMAGGKQASRDEARIDAAVDARDDELWFFHPND